MNGVILQAFHWYSWGGGGHWSYLRDQASALAAAGFTAVWLPPPTKGCSPADANVGYAPYDLFDLGEYDQQGSVATKYGTRQQLVDAIGALKAAGLQVYLDAVLNHRAGADAAEWVEAVRIDPEHRQHETGPWQAIRAFTRFDFAGRLATAGGRALSSKLYGHDDFDAVDYDASDPPFPNERRIYKLKRKPFTTGVSQEHDNYDYLMHADHDMGVAAVVEDLQRWASWVLEHTDADGFRLDAAKHVRSFFFRDLLGQLRTSRPDREVFAVGEYWATETAPLHQFIDQTGSGLALFDVPLQTRFHDASRSGPRSDYDLRALLHGTLSAEQPTLAVTFVENHDTQPLQSLEQVVEAWFKPSAYAFILLRQRGYPCVFHGDWTGADYSDRGRDGTGWHTIHLDSHQWVLRRLLAARRISAHGEQLDYADQRNLLAWSRLGTRVHNSGLVALINNGPAEARKWMETRRPDTEFVELLGQRGETVRTNEWGWGEFVVNPEACSVWVPTFSLPALTAMLG